MPRISILTASAAISMLLIACSPSGERLASTGSALRLTPAQAVINAAEMEEGVGGVFEMVVRATGNRRGRVFLNSEADYRDPRNLTIVIGPQAQGDLADRFGGPIEQALKEKVIAVRGVARKTRITFFANGRPTDKYYFQTQLVLQSARDLTVEGEKPRA